MTSPIPPISVMLLIQNLGGVSGIHKTFLSSGWAKQSRDAYRHLRLPNYYLNYVLKSNK